MREPRQLNVQQQNARTLRSLRAEAEHWRRHPWPEALRLCAEERGIDPARSIILSLEIDYPGISGLFGLLLTQDECFISFEIDTDEPEPKVYEWLDVTDTQNVNAHNRGIGAGDRALALRLLGELNSGTPA